MAVEEILIIDQEPSGLDAIRSAITSRGYGVHEFPSGSAALELLMKGCGQTRAIFVSQNIGDMAALDLIRQLKSEENLRQIPIVALASGQDHPGLIELVTNGASSYLLKPYDEALAVAVMLSVLREWRKMDAMVRESKEVVGATQLLETCTFAFTTPAQARAIATFLSQVCPDPSRVIVGLSELMVNGVEHGNLDISYEQKSKFIQDGTLEAEIAFRLKMPQYQGRTVRTSFHRQKTELVFRVEDDGPGFDWQSYLDIDMSRLRDTHGRGIAIAKQISFDTLTYEGLGNSAVATVTLPDLSELAPM